ncbi:MAG: triose-phosphate isomerase [Magnetococcales bacterium]|nr:triose-phosphate isomerase [Magnetococcales bacterium]
MQRRALVVGNWKMNGSIGFAQTLAAAVSAGVAERQQSQTLHCDVILCPPFTALFAARSQMTAPHLFLGGQTMAEQANGPFTGEISGSMLEDAGCSHVILGHSERRTLFGENNALVARKMAAAFRVGLRPIVCLGETLAERNAKQTLEVIQSQLAALFGLLPTADPERSQWVLAYEPVWAIGTGCHATPDQIQEVHGFIREQLRAQVGATIASALQILYGGSVTPDNAAAIFAQPDVDGGLIGGASLKAEAFLAIVDAYPKKI